MTISNEGARDVAFLGVGFGDLGYPKDVGAGSTCTASTFDGYCLVPGLSAGDRRTITFGFSLPQSGLPASGTVQVDHYDADHLLWPDLAGEDNHVEFQVG